MSEPTLSHDIVVRIPESLSVVVTADGAGDPYLQIELTDTGEFYDFVKSMEQVASRLLAV